MDEHAAAPMLLKPLLVRHRLNLCLAAFSVLVSFVLAEIGFRVYLNRMIPKSQFEHLDFDLVSRSYWEYDEALGFRYKPNYTADWIAIKDSLPYKAGTLMFDRRGNSGLEVDSSDSEVRIAVVGDSFTQIQHDGVTWPHLLTQLLRLRTGRKVTVENHAREGYGILQMLDQASQLVDEKPDAILIAFITPDLRRARFWRTEIQTPGGVEVYTSTTPVLQLDRPATYVRTTLVHPLATREWGDQMVVTKDRDDPALRSILDSYVRARDNYYVTRFDPLSLRVSYLLERIAGRRIRGTGLTNPIVSYASYAQDRRFMDAVWKLKQSGIPVYLVHLPFYPELVAGTYLLSGQNAKLFTSLKAITQFPLLEMLPSSPMGPHAEVMILWPGNLHPSLHGLRYYAARLADPLVQRLHSGEISSRQSAARVALELPASAAR